MWYQLVRALGVLCVWWLPFTGVHAQTSLDYNGWVPLRIPDAAGSEPSRVIISGMYEWGRQQPIVATRLQDQTSAVARVYRSLPNFRQAFIARYPMFATSQVSREVLRSRLPRYQGMTGITLPPFPEVGVITVVESPRDTGADRNLTQASRYDELNRLVLGVVETQQTNTQAMQALRTELRALAVRLDGYGRTVAGMESARTQMVAVSDQMQTLTGGQAIARDRLAALEWFKVWVVWFVVVAGVIVILLLAALLLNAIAMWKRVRAAEAELNNLKKSISHISPPATTPPTP